MQSMQRRIAEVRQLVVDEGLELIDLVQKHHIKVNVSNGRATKLFIFSSSRGCHRGLLNARALLRKFKKEADDGPR